MNFFVISAPFTYFYDNFGEEAPPSPLPLPRHAVRERHFLYGHFFAGEATTNSSASLIWKTISFGKLIFMIRSLLHYFNFHNL
jgi:hypothetical protein